MYIILLAVIVIAIYFVGDLFINKIRMISMIPSQGWNYGFNWFMLLLAINVIVLIFVPVYYYFHDDTGNIGRKGNTGNIGIQGSNLDGCSNCR
jgi:hypothetical protein